ncbi:hypothetical protein FH972_021469 [Carpinus fangiana]|uniref:Uncharacterized protein n=1 Tax=Carpinus fangiana TaxID=176857 RepID=A0A5N6KQ10_9ROSI|nr:hypothetical protein FH972_021469 [Carpinus fangiana]
MPIAPAAKGTRTTFAASSTCKTNKAFAGIIILTPIIIAASYAIYDSHAPFRSFVDEQWRKWQEFTEQQGWGHNRRREEMPFSGQTWDTADGTGFNTMDTNDIPEGRRGKKRTVSVELGRTTAKETLSTDGMRNRTRESGEIAMLDTDLKLQGPLSKSTRAAAPKLSPSEHGARKLLASMDSDIDAASEWSGNSVGAIYTPTSEESSLFGGGDETTEQEYESAMDLQSSRSESTGTLVDEDFSMIRSPGRLGGMPGDGQDTASTSSSWSEIGTENSFDNRS